MFGTVYVHLETVFGILSAVSQEVVVAVGSRNPVVPGKQGIISENDISVYIAVGRLYRTVSVKYVISMVFPAAAYLVGRNASEHNDIILNILSICSHGNNIPYTGISGKVDKTLEKTGT